MIESVKIGFHVIFILLLYSNTVSGISYGKYRESKTKKHLLFSKKGGYMKISIKKVVSFCSTLALTCTLMVVMAACSSASSTTTASSVTTATPTATTSSSSAQRQSYSGTVAVVNGDTLTLTTSQGTVTINISSSTTIEKTVNGTNANLGQGDFVTINGTTDSNGNLDATLITVRAQGSSFPSIGTSGNGGGFTIPNSGSSGTGTGITIGTISTINGNSFTVTTTQSSVIVNIGPDTVIETTENGSSSDLQTGASLTVAGTTSSNGSISATSITIASPAVYAVGIFLDNACNDPITSLNWGNLIPGSSATQTLYLENLDNQTVTVTATSSIAKTTGLTFSNSGPLSMIHGNLGPTVYQLQMTLAASSKAVLGNLTFNINFAGGIPVGITNQVDIVAASNAPSSTTTTAKSVISLSSITVTPASPILGGVGSTQQFIAIGTYSNTSIKDITSQVTWGSSNTAIATISSTGLATSVAVGNTNITATMSGTTSPPVSLKVIAPTLSSVDITPASPSNLAAGFSQNFRVIGTYSDGSTTDVTSQVTWASSNTAVATISSTGTVTGVATGTVSITASVSGIISPSVSLTVVAPIVSAIAITPVAPANLKIGSSQQFIAIETYSDGSTANVTAQVIWASSNTADATISATGLATGVAVGNTNITATLTGITSPAVTLIVVSP